VVTVIVPFHQGERLPSFDIPRPDGEAVVIDAELPDAGMWPRLQVLYEHVADAVASAQQAGRWSCPATVWWPLRSSQGCSEQQ
jgi:hypothetical protein